MRGNAHTLLCSLAAAVGVIAATAGERWWNDGRRTGALWMVAALLTCVALASPRRHRPAVLVGGVVGTVVAAMWVRDLDPREAVSVSIACTIEVLAVVLLSDRWLPDGPSIQRTRNAQTFFGIAVIAGFLGATVSVVDQADGRFESWWHWMLAATVGQLVVTPVALTRQAHLITPARGRQLWELIFTVVELGALTALALLLDAPLLFTAVPLVMWLAIRFGPRLTAPLSVVMAVAVAAASNHGSGPFADRGTNVGIQMQLFCMSVALSSLIAGGHALRAWRDHGRLAGILAAIPDVVLVRDQRGNVVDAWVPQGHQASVASLAPDVVGSPPIIDDEPPQVAEPSLVGTPDGRTFERRAATVRGQRTVEFYRDVTAERQARKELRRRQEAIDDARTAEQARIARAIHDSPLQLLAAAKIRVETAESEITNDAAAELLTGAAGLIAQSIGELRGQLTALTPPDVAAGAVVPALEQVARRVLEPHVTVSARQATERRLDPAVATVLFQAGREALANAAKHAQASSVDVELVDAGGVAVLTVRDDGVGPTVTTGDREHVGLALVRERVDAVGGRLELLQETGAGSALVVRVPTVAAPS